jgi:signal transduction histidine kinase
MNSEGVWSNECNYTFTIRPPWWKTWLFYVLSVLSFISVIFIYIKWRERELEQQNRELEKKVKEQTHELKAKNEELQIANLDLQDTNSEKDKFFSIIAHDVRGPLGSFLSLTEIMAEEIELFTKEEVLEMTKTMKRSAANLFELLGNLLEWARMQRGLTSYSAQKINLNELINESSEILLQTAQNKSITVNIAVQAGLEVVADRNMLSSVIRNITSNAVKFTPRLGKITISAFEIENGMVEFTVKDSGIGMDQQMVKDLFRININNRRQGTEGESSTGLGLLLCKDFVERLGGKIWIESGVLQGTTIHFTLHSVNSNQNSF